MVTHKPLEVQLADIFADYLAASTIDGQVALAPKKPLFDQRDLNDLWKEALRLPYYQPTEVVRFNHQHGRLTYASATFEEDNQIATVRMFPSVDVRNAAHFTTDAKPGYATIDVLRGGYDRELRQFASGKAKIFEDPNGDNHIFANLFGHRRTNGAKRRLMNSLGDWHGLPRCPLTGDVFTGKEKVELYLGAGCEYRAPKFDGRAIISVDGLYMFPITQIADTLSGKFGRFLERPQNGMSESASERLLEKRIAGMLESGDYRRTG